MTRVLLFIEHWPAVSGAARVLLTALACLDRARYRAVVVCNAGRLVDEARAQGHEVVPLDLPVLTFSGGASALARTVFRFASASRAIHRLVGELRPRAIHANGLAPALYAALPARLAGAPLVWHVHEIYENRLRMRPVVRVAAAASQAIVCVSRAAAERTSTLGAPAEKCRVVHNTVPVPLATEHAGAAAPREMPDRAACVVAVGVITPAKGYDVLLDAAARIVRRHPRTTFAIVGSPLFPGDAEYLQRLRARVSELGLCDRVEFLGFRRDAAEIIRGATLLVHPATYEETFGLVLLEAMSAGRPVVATRVGGIPEIVAHGDTGLLVPPGNADELAAAVCALLDQPERGARMGRAGRKVAIERFGRVQMISALNEVYRDVIGDEPFVVPASERATGHPQNT